jgi:hypothetical protein
MAEMLGIITLIVAFWLPHSLRAGGPQSIRLSNENDGTKA